MKTHVVIMAAGKGTRMKSEVPKVLHTIGGKTLIERVLDAVHRIDTEPTIVVGYKAEEVIAKTGEKNHYVVQKEQWGTGHAISVAVKHLEGRHIDQLIVVPGDHPLLSTDTLRELAEAQASTGATIALGTILVPDFEGWRASFVEAGRIVRDADNNVLRIIEHKDATSVDLGIKELNVSFYCFDFAWLCEHVDTLSNANAAKEYYLTDFIGIAQQQGRKIIAHRISRTEEGFGVNSPEQLARAEKHLMMAKS